MPVFEVTHDNLVELQPTSFAAQGLRERGDLERLLRTRIHVVAPGASTRHALPRELIEHICVFTMCYG